MDKEIEEARKIWAIEFEKAKEAASEVRLAEEAKIEAIKAEKKAWDLYCKLGSASNGR